MGTSNMDMGKAWSQQNAFTHCTNIIHGDNTDDYIHCLWHTFSEVQTMPTAGEFPGVVVKLTGTAAIRIPPLVRPHKEPRMRPRLRFR